VSHTFSQLGWEVFDFASKLGLCCEGFNPCKEIIAFVMALEVTSVLVFSSKTNGKQAKFLTKKDCETFCK